MRFLVLGFLGYGTVVVAQEANDVAMITALQGGANLHTPQGVRVLQPFSRLKRGDRLTVSHQSLLKLIFFASGRQEIWRGKGEVEILDAESKGVGLSGPDAKILPGFMVKQIEKTPSASSVPRSNSVRSRSIGGGVERIEASYRRMRMEAVQGDLNPELFLLSALFEMREIDRVEQVLAELRAAHPVDGEVRVVIALYQKAVRNLRESGGK